MSHCQPAQSPTTTTIYLSKEQQKCNSHQSTSRGHWSLLWEAVALSFLWGSVETCFSVTGPPTSQWSPMELCSPPLFPECCSENIMHDPNLWDLPSTLGLWNLSRVWLCLSGILQTLQTVSTAFSHSFPPVGTPNCDDRGKGTPSVVMFTAHISSASVGFSQTPAEMSVAIAFCWLTFLNRGVGCVVGGGT